MAVRVLTGFSQALYSSDILYIITLWLTRCSVAFLSLRLSPNKGHTVTLYVILLGATVLMFISIFVVALRCDLAHPWIFIDPPCTTDLVRLFGVIVLPLLTTV
jgi:hypothetical protein